MKPFSYTEPKLCTYSNNLKKPWLVYFDIIDNESLARKRLQFRGKINRFKTVAARLKEGAVFIEYWKYKLRNGWNPFIAQHSQIPDFANMTLNQALDFGLSKCTVAKKTYSGYKGIVEFFKKAAKQLFIDTLPVQQIKRRHIKLILERIKQSRKWKNREYNKNIGWIGAIFSQLVEWEVIDYNPAHNIKHLPVAETRRFVPYTNAEKKIIREYLYLNHYRFFIVFIVIYSTGIRPKEVVALQIKDVDLTNRLITIRPDLERENSKTKNIRYVPIDNHLLSFLKQMEIENYNKNYFLFGSPYQSGRGHRGQVVGHTDYFKPSAVGVKRDTITKFWKKIIIDKLGIKKYLYSAKASGADDKILAGISIEALKEMYGHTSYLMTKKYISVLQKISFNEIIEKSPSF